MHKDYARGYQQALADTGKCGAHNEETPAPLYGACIRPDGHTGMHDDGWRRWGDREATTQANRLDARTARYKVT